MSQAPEAAVRYPIPARTHRVQEVIRRSRFITTVTHAPDSESAHRFLEKIREEFPDATHHCWAFVAGPPGSTTAIGMSDDGEPHGTAGRPMLNALLHGGVGEIAAVSTRYFGGTKLGTGGLSRAYSGGIKLALESLPTREKIERTTVRIRVDYESVDTLKHLLEEAEALVIEEAYEAQVTFLVSVPAAALGGLEGKLAGVTRGQGVMERPDDTQEEGPITPHG